MLHSSKLTAALVLGLAGIAGGALARSQPPVPAAAPDLKGQWRSERPEAYGSFFATRAFVIGEHAWQLQYQAYADAQGRQPLFTLRVNGNYVLGEPSATVAGAVEGIFPVQARSLTVHSEAATRMFAAQGCQLQIGREKPLVNTGCGFVPGVMQAMGEYDLVALKGGRLYFGDRAGDLTKARPNRLTPFPLERVQ